MQKFSFKIAFSIIVAGIFIVASYAAINYDNLHFPFYIVSACLMVFIFLFAFAVGSNYAAPIKELLDVIDGKKKAIPPNNFPPKTKDEIEELSKAFSKITEGLERSTTDIETLKRTSDIKFKTKDLVSEKIIDALEEKIRNRTSEMQKVVTELQQAKDQLRTKDREITDLTSQLSKKRKPRTSKKEQ